MGKWWIVAPDRQTRRDMNVHRLGLLIKKLNEKETLHWQDCRNAFFSDIAPNLLLPVSQDYREQWHFNSRLRKVATRVSRGVWKLKPEYRTATNPCIEIMMCRCKKFALAPEMDIVIAKDKIVHSNGYCSR